MRVKHIFLIMSLLFTAVFFTPASTEAASTAPKEKGYTIKSFQYVKLDGSQMISQTAAIEDAVKITMVLPKQNDQGDWLAYGFTSIQSYDAFVKKDKQRLENRVDLMGTGPCCTDFYDYKDKGGSYIYWRSGTKNLPSSWNDRISSLSTASPSYSHSTVLWEHVSSQGYGKGVSFRHSDWYGKTANMASDWNNKASAIQIK